MSGGVAGGRRRRAVVVRVPLGGGLGYCSCVLSVSPLTSPRTRTTARGAEEPPARALRHRANSNTHPQHLPVGHGVHTSLDVPSAEHAQLRQQKINLLCERALALDAHDRICLGDCLRHGQRRV